MVLPQTLSTLLLEVLSVSTYYLILGVSYLHARCLLPGNRKGG